MIICVKGKRENQKIVQKTRKRRRWGIKNWNFVRKFKTTNEKWYDEGKRKDVLPWVLVYSKSRVKS